MSKHTELPWEIVSGTGIYSRLGADSGDGLRCSKEDGWHIAEIADTPTYVDGIGDVELGRDTKSANACLIVNAVNNYDRLREALRRVSELDYMSVESALDWLENNCPRLRALLKELDNLENDHE